MMKIFYYHGGVDKILTNFKYNDTKNGLNKSTGNPVEYQLVRVMESRVQGWHNISDEDKLVIIAEYIKNGWVEGEEV